MTKDDILEKFLTTSPDQWDELISTLPGVSTTLLQQLDNELDQRLQTIAKLSGYFAARGASGCGDSGHYRGLISANGKLTSIRLALGYTNP